MEDTKIISKGSYSTFRFNDFVSVKQYLLIREKGAKYLLLKFCNDAANTVTGLKLTIDQLDVRGTCVEKSHVEWNNLNGLAGSEFIAPEKIPLRENCVEVKINLVGAVYGEYTYSVKSNELVVVYDKKKAKNDEDYSINTNGANAVIRERKFKRPFSIIAASIGVILCATVGALVHLYNFKKVERRFLWDGLQYEFTTDNKETGAPIRVVGYTGSEPDLVIPATLEGYPVVSVSSSAFRGNSNIRSLTIEANVEIANNAFESCHNLTTVELSNVTKVGESAFYRCTSLRDVSINNLQVLGQRAFMNCQSMQTLTITGEAQTLTLNNEAFANCSSLRTVTIEQTVSYPHTLNVFTGVNNVQELTLKHYNSAKHESSTTKTIADLFGGSNPRSLTQLTIGDIDEIPEGFCAKGNALKKADLQGLKSGEIGEKAFFECRGLTDLSLKFENKNTVVTSVGDYAFYETNIGKFDGKYLTSIGEYAFAQNPSLTSMNVAENTALNQLGRGAFQGCSALTSFYLPQGITSLANEVFDGCKSMYSFTFGLGTTINSFGKNSLKGCESITALNLPASTRTIGESAFEDCTGLTSIHIPNAVTSVGKRAFANCSSLTEISLPTAVNTLGIGVLQDCTALQSLETPFVGSTDNNRAFLAAMFGGTSTSDMHLVPSTLQTVKLTRADDIPENAFLGVTSLKKVTLNEGIRSIGSYAFYGCTNLRELYLSEALEYIADGAFSDCYLLFEIWNLSDLSIVRGDSAHGNIAKYALAVYDNENDRNETANEKDFRFLKAEEGWYMVDYLGTDTQWTLPTAFKNSLGLSVQRYTIVPYLFHGRTDVKQLTVTSGVERMGERAFAWCTNLEKITYQSGVTLEEIGVSAYEQCGSLTTVNMPSNCRVERIGESAFFGCYSLQSVTLPNALKEIGNYAFAGCGELKGLSVGSNVTSMGYAMLSDATSLQTLTIPFVGETIDSNNYLGYLFGTDINSAPWGSLEKVTVTSMSEVPYKAFYGFNSLTTVVWNSTADTIGGYAFADCSSLQSVNISGVKVIEDCAFFRCASLQAITLSNPLETIGGSAFAESGLTTISFPSSVKTIGDSAFSYTQLTRVSFPRYLQTLGNYAFSSNQELTDVDMTGYPLSYIPEYAFYNCSALETIMIPAGVSDIRHYAFESCSRLYEVYNLNHSLDIRRGTTDYGYVAYNAVIVHDSSSDTRLKEVTVDGMIFKYAESEREACLFKYEGSENYLAFSSVRLGSRTYSTYWIYRNAFSDNYYLEGLDTGVVTEISEYAFYNCGNLKEVMVSNSLVKCGDNAFGGCSNLWEVWDNNATFNLSKGSSDCGYVAYYAVALNQDIIYSEAGQNNEFKFMSFGGKTYLYRYDGYSYNDFVRLPDIGEDYEFFKDDKRSSIFYSWSTTLVVPTAVKKIPVGAISSIGAIYYDGTESQWTSVATEESVSRSRVYYYKECIHSMDAYTKYWTEYRGSYTTGETYYYTQVVITSSTCQQQGKQVDRCDKCHLDFYEMLLPVVNHSFDGANGSCKWCQQTPVKSGDLGNLLDVQNISVYPYFINASKAVYSDWRADYDNSGRYTSSVTFIARKNITLTFDVDVVGDEEVTYRILVNGKEYSSATNQDKTKIEVELQEGKSITFEMSLKGDKDTERRIYIKNIKATEIVQKEA